MQVNQPTLANPPARNFHFSSKPSAPSTARFALSGIDLWKFSMIRNFTAWHHVRFCSRFLVYTRAHLCIQHQVDTHGTKEEEEEVEDRTAPFRENSSLKHSEWHVLEESHSFICHPHTYPGTEWAILRPRPSHSESLHFGRYSFPIPQNDRRLSWPGWLVTYRGGMPACKTITHPSTGRHTSH